MMTPNLRWSIAILQSQIICVEIANSNDPNRALLLRYSTKKSFHPRVNGTLSTFATLAIARTRTRCPTALQQQACYRCNPLQIAIISICLDLGVFATSHRELVPRPALRPGQNLFLQMVSQCPTSTSTRQAMLQKQH